MPELALTEVAAWALIAGGLGYAALATYGRAAATVTAALAALAVKHLLIDGI